MEPTHTNGTDSVFAWEGVKYGVKKGKRAKEILKGLQGSLSGGEVCAILGPSGAGKSSLLNVLAGRIRHKGEGQRVAGTITLDGKSVTGSGELRKRIAYVMQEDLLFATQTPREALMFSAKLRLPRAMSNQEKVERVESMLTDLGLLDCANTFIGDDLIRGISGGEKKRTSIGVELVMNPSLIFLDEPTSGLDSFAAQAVIRKLRELALGGRRCNVLCTIHQPSSEVFHTFHKAMFIYKGREFFFGSIHQLSTSLATHGKGCPNEYNLADHAIDLIQSQSAEAVDELASQLIATTAKAHAAASHADASDAKGGKGGGATGGGHVWEAGGGFWTQLQLLTLREAQGIYRNKPALIASIIAPVLLNLFFASLFTSVGKTGDAGYSIKGHFGAIANVAIGGMFASAQPLLLRFPLDRGTFLREIGSKAYGVPAYVISKATVELPQAFVNACLVWAAFYFVAALQGPWIYHVLIFWIEGMAAGGTAFLVGCLAADPNVAAQLAPPIFVLQLLFAGVFIDTDQIPDAVSWIQYLASLKYGINLHILTEFGSSTRAAGNWTAAQDFAAEQLIAQNDIYESDWWVYVLAVIGLFVFFRAVGILALWYKASQFF